MDQAAATILPAPASNPAQELARGGRASGSSSAIPAQTRPNLPVSLRELRKAADEAEAAWITSRVDSYFTHVLDADAPEGSHFSDLRVANPPGIWLSAQHFFVAEGKELKATFFLNFPTKHTSGGLDADAKGLCYVATAFVELAGRNSYLSLSACPPFLPNKEDKPYLAFDAFRDPVFSETTSYLLLPLDTSVGAGPLRYLASDRASWEEASGFQWRPSSKAAYEAVSREIMGRMERGAR